MDMYIECMKSKRKVARLDYCAHLKGLKSLKNKSFYRRDTEALSFYVNCACGAVNIESVFLRASAVSCFIFNFLVRTINT